MGAGHHDDTLAADGLRAAEAVWRAEEPAARAAAGDHELAARVHAAVEPFLTTRKDEYRRAVVEAAPVIKKQIAALGWIVGRALPEVVPESDVKVLKGRIRELERLLGRKTLGNEILNDAI
jgi:hypothetical protein